MLLDEQEEAVETLLERLGTVEAVADSLGVSTDSVSLWRQRKRVAKGLTRQKLLSVVRQIGNSVMEAKSSIPNRGRKLTKDRRNQIKLELKKLKLAPPEVRAATLRALLSKSGLTITALADAFGIHENTLKYYLDPNCEMLMKTETAMRIADFAKKLKAGPAPKNLKQRLEAALEKLIGKDLLSTGFFDWDPRRAAAANKISTFTGLHNRTVRRYLPPLKSKRIPEAVVAAFELAAADLGNILQENSGSPDQ